MKSPGGRRVLLLLLAGVTLAACSRGRPAATVAPPGTQPQQAVLIFEAQLNQLALGQNAEDAMKSVVTVVERRVNALGVAGATTERDGNRVTVRLPGIKDPTEAISLITQTGHLDFRKQELSPSGEPVTDADGNFVWVPATGNLNGQDVPLTGQYMKPNARAAFDAQANAYEVQFELTADGAKLFEQITGELWPSQRLLAVFLDNRLITAPTVNAVIHDKGVICDSSMTFEQAKLLAVQLNTGELPIPLRLVSQTTGGSQ
jgi:protein-export membrane protein SecD